MTDLIFTTRRTGLPRVWGGLLALGYPFVLAALAVNQGFGTTGVSGMATAFLAAVLLLLATPTAWVFVFDFIEVSPFTTVSIGLLTSLPLWYLAGAALADGASSWTQWLRRYGAVCALWTALNLVVLAMLSAL